MVTKEYSGSDLSGSDGEANRVLTLSNLNRTQDSGFYVYVDGLLKSSDDYSVTHKNSNTEITFSIKIWNDQKIIVVYETSVSETVSTRLTTQKDVLEYLNSYSEIRGEVIGTGSGTYSLANKYIIEGTETIYTGSTEASADSWDYDNGKVTITNTSGDEISVDYDYGIIPNSVLKTFVSQTEDKVENMAHRKFTRQSRTEYLDADSNQTTFFLKYYPVLSSSVAINESSETETPDWKTLSAGLGNDYLIDNDDESIGRLRFIDNFPDTGKNKVKVDYTFGYSSGSIPSAVKELATLECARKVLNSQTYKSTMDGKEFSPASQERMDRRIEELRKILKKEIVSLV